MKTFKKLGTRIIESKKPKTFSEKFENALPWWIPRIRFNVYMDGPQLILVALTVVALLLGVAGMAL